MAFSVRAIRLPPALPGHLLASALVALVFCSTAPAAGFDHRVAFDDSGIWKRSNQQALYYGLIGGEIAGAIWLGGEDRLGKTFWQALDSSALGGIVNESFKHIFTRARPSQNPDPNAWFQGPGHYSFPSGEVTAVTSSTDATSRSSTGSRCCLLTMLSPE